MITKKHFPRCFICRQSGLYVAHCIDFGLACQHESADEARSKLDGMIASHVLYIADLAEEGHWDAAKRMFERKSSITIRARYWLSRVFHAFSPTTSL